MRALLWCLPLLAALAACGTEPIGASRMSPGDPVAGAVRPPPGSVSAPKKPVADPLERVAAAERAAAAERDAAEKEAAARAAVEREAAEREAAASQAEARAGADGQSTAKTELPSPANVPGTGSDGRASRVAGSSSAPSRAQAALPAPARVPVTIAVGPSGQVRTIAEAARLAKDGDTVEVQAGEYRGDVAVWTQKKLTIRAVGGRAILIADGRHAEGKGIWVVRGGEVTVEGFDFIGARVPSGNGAGIRFDRGRLTVRDSRFLDNQMSLLTGNDQDSELIVENCEFTGPRDGPRHYHNLYVGSIARLSLTGSWLHSARVGHLVKSRARVNRVLYNRITDEDGNGSYELEFPAGGDARVIGNLIEQSARTENAVIVSYGVEGYKWVENRLEMAHNTLVNLRMGGGTFVRVSPGASDVVLLNNLWVGAGSFMLPDNAIDEGNRRVSLRAFVAPDRYDYHPVSLPAVDAAKALAVPELVPVAEYRHPRSVHRLAGAPTMPGAFQP